VVAGCVVTGIDADGREVTERVARGQMPMFWGHYRLASDGRQLWLADYNDRESAIAAAKDQARSRPIYVEDSGLLIRVSA